jgi:hypothetical protein
MDARRYAQTVIMMTVILVFAQNGFADLANSVDFGSVGLLSGHVDYQVYAPGTYTSSITDYVYAYQLFNDQTSTVGIDSFSVGLSSDVHVSSAWCVLTGPQDKIPTPLLPPTSVFYLFLSGNVKAGGNSGILLFTSDCPPEPGIGSVTGGTAGSINVNVQTPWLVPEPATFGLLIGGTLMAIKRRRKV